jgi:hypothetical protein
MRDGRLIFCVIWFEDRMNGAAQNREYSPYMLDECIGPIWLDEAIQFWSG